VAISTLKRHYAKTEREAQRDAEELARMRRKKPGSAAAKGTTGAA
jgi:hypothetical protein